MDRLKVKENESLERDSHSKAILNADRSAYVQARSRKKRMLKKEKENDNLRLEFHILKKEHEILKSMVERLINKQ